MSGINLAPSEKRPDRLNFAIRELMRGRSNAIGTCTLAPSASSTTVAAPNCASGSAVFLFPQTAHAAAVVATTFVAPANVANGSFKITHASSANTDQTFWFVCLG